MGFTLGSTPLGGSKTPGVGILPLMLGGASTSAAAPTIDAHYVSASSGFRFHGAASTYVSPIVVLATSSIGLSASVSLAARFWAVSAATGFKLGASATADTNSQYHVSAFTQVRFGAHVGMVANHAYSVSAASGFKLRPRATNTRICVASASSSFTVRSSSTSGRDLHVSASNSLSLSPHPRSNGFFAKSATSNFVIHASAHVDETATVAASGFVLTDLATAVVWMPWRRPAGLSRPPGGNQPHS